MSFSFFSLVSFSFVAHTPPPAPVFRCLEGTEIYSCFRRLEKIYWQWHQIKLCSHNCCHIFLAQNMKPYSGKQQLILLHLPSIYSTDRGEREEKMSSLILGHHYLPLYPEKKNKLKLEFRIQH